MSVAAHGNVTGVLLCEQNTSFRRAMILPPFRWRLGRHRRRRGRRQRNRKVHSSASGRGSRNKMGTLGYRTGIVRHEYEGIDPAAYQPITVRHKQGGVGLGALPERLEVADFGSYPAAMTELGTTGTPGDLLAPRQRRRFVGRAVDLAGPPCSMLRPPRPGGVGGTSYRRDLTLSRL